MSDSISFSSTKEPFFIFSTTLPGMGGRAVASDTAAAAELGDRRGDGAEPNSEDQFKGLAELELADMGPELESPNENNGSEEMRLRPVLDPPGKPEATEAVGRERREGEKERERERNR